MANIKGVQKRARQDKKRNELNASFKSSMRTAIKSVEKASSKEEGQKALVTAQKKLDKAVTKGLVHKNTAARTKSRLASLVNAL